MTRQVRLPPGCSGLQMEDGTHYKDRPGGMITVSDGHATAINRLPGNGDAGLVSAPTGEFFRARGKGRVCRQCSPNRRYFPFTGHCHRCGAETEPE